MDNTPYVSSLPSWQFQTLVWVALIVTAVGCYLFGKWNRK